jgi:hypothetical protein
MKNSLVQLAIAVIAVNAASQVPALAYDPKPMTMYVIGSNAPLPTRPNREMFGRLPEAEAKTEAMAPSIVASQVESTNPLKLRPAIQVTTAKGW